MTRSAAVERHHDDLDLLTYEDVADLLGVSTRTVRRYILAGDLECIHLGPRYVRIRRSQLQAFIDAHADSV
jgi:excisionase family DNA binding protein